MPAVVRIRSDRQWTNVERAVERRKSMRGGLYRKESTRCVSVFGRSCNRQEPSPDGLQGMDCVEAIHFPLFCQSRSLSSLSFLQRTLFLTLPSGPVRSLYPASGLILQRNSNRQSLPRRAHTSSRCSLHKYHCDRNAKGGYGLQEVLLLTVVCPRLSSYCLSPLPYTYSSPK